MDDIEVKASYDSHRLYRETDRIDESKNRDVKSRAKKRVLFS